MGNTESGDTVGEWATGILVAVARLASSPLRKIWRWLRVGPRVEIELGWKWAPIIVLDRPTPTWRSVDVTITAAQYQEFVLARGVVEARPAKSRKWTESVDVEPFVHLPKTVSANQQQDFSISGKSLLGAFSSEIRAEPFEIRVSLRDHHRTRIKSEPLLVDEGELLRKEYR